MALVESVAAQVPSPQTTMFPLPSLSRSLIWALLIIPGFGMGEMANQWPHVQLPLAL